MTSPTSTQEKPSGDIDSASAATYHEEGCVGDVCDGGGGGGGGSDGVECKRGGGGGGGGGGKEGGGGGGGGEGGTRFQLLNQKGQEFTNFPRGPKQIDVVKVSQKNGIMYVCMYVCMCTLYL